jgi:hypothetical protein
MSDRLKDRLIHCDLSKADSEASVVVCDGAEGSDWYKGCL